MQYAEAFKEYVKAQTMYMNEIQSIRHDMQAHLLVLHYYLKEENYESAKTYLAGMMGKQGLWNPPPVDVGHDMVNAVIRYTLEKSDAEIELRHSGFLPESMTVEDMDLCTVFSNLLRNSVEACEKLIHAPRRILLQIQSVDKDIVIQIENPVETAVELGILGKGTTKDNKNGHGYGIANCKAVIEKYGGRMEFEITESLFRVKILLSDVVKSPFIC